jgi:hypothetical protein
VLPPVIALPPTPPAPPVFAPPVFAPPVFDPPVFDPPMFEPPVLGLVPPVDLPAVAPPTPVPPPAANAPPVPTALPVPEVAVVSELDGDDEHAASSATALMTEPHTVVLLDLMFIAVCALGLWIDWSAAPSIAPRRPKAHGNGRSGRRPHAATCHDLAHVSARPPRTARLSRVHRRCAYGVTGVPGGLGG